MVSTLDSALERLGLSSHQAVYVVHNDAPHPHIHAFLNLVNHENGRSNSVKYSKEKLSHWAEEYERVHGLQCEQRVVNNAKRTRENKRLAFNRASGNEQTPKAEYPRYKEKEMWLRDELTRRYHASDDGQSFLAAVRELGCDIAQGKRVVLIGPDGGVHSLSRQLDGVSAAELRKRLRGLSLETADDARRTMMESQRSSGGSGDDCSNKRKGPHARKPVPESDYFDRDKQHRHQERRVGEAGISHQVETVRTGLANRLQDAQHHRLGAFYEESEQRRHALDRTMEAQYGAHERQLLRSIARREKRLEASSGIKHWYVRNFTRETERLSQDRHTLASIQQRRQEARDGLANAIESRRVALSETIARERLALNRELKPSEVDALARSIEAQERAADDAHARHVAASAEQTPSLSGAFERERAAYLATLGKGGSDVEDSGTEDEQMRPTGTLQGVFNAESGSIEGSVNSASPTAGNYGVERQSYLRQVSAGSERSSQQTQTPDRDVG